MASPPRSRSGLDPLKKFIAGGLIALLLGACSSSGEKVSQPDDEFLDEVESVCRDASEGIRKLTAGTDAPADLLEIVSDSADSLSDLSPTSDLRNDWNKYTAKLDEQVSSLREVVTALTANDTGGMQAALNDLNDESTDADLLVNTLGAIRCRGLVPFNALTPEDLGTDISVVTTPPTDATTPATDTTPLTEATLDTEPVNTPLSIDTIPITEAPPPPPSTEAPADIFPTDLSVEAIAPEGYQWVAFDPPTATGLYSNSVIGDLVVSYAAGEFQAIDNASITATAYVVTLSTDFTPEYVKAYQFWEAVDHGTDVVTPAGRTVHLEAGAFPDIDCAVFTALTRGVSLCTFTGTDTLALIDQFLTANGF